MAKTPLDPATSHFLDLSRILAAFMVVLHHVFEPPFHSGAVGFPGRQAVIVFFVISGFVIAYSTDGQRDWRRYATARLARIYSVAVPALVLSWALLWVQNSWPGMPPSEVDQPAVRFVISMLFANQFWNLTVAALTNGPYWSLCYEVWYYVLFAILAFMHGLPRVVGVALLVAMVGPRILLLLPVWGLGAGLYHLMKRCRPAQPALERALFWLCVVLLVGCMLRGSPADRVTDWVRSHLVDGYVVVGPVRGFIGGDARFASDWLLGLLFAGCVFFSRNGLQAGRAWTAWRHLVQVCSSYTFSLYLYHAPVLVFAHAALAPSLAPAAVPWVMLATILCVVALLGRYTEHHMEPWRRLFGTMLGRQARSSA